MAGSIKHVTNDDAEGTWRGFELIDNMGDAYEACEELFNDRRRLQRGIVLAVTDLRSSKRARRRNKRQVADDLEALLSRAYRHEGAVR